MPPSFCFDLQKSEKMTPGYQGMPEPEGGTYSILGKDDPAFSIALSQEMRARTPSGPPGEGKQGQRDGRMDGQMEVATAGVLQGPVAALQEGKMLTAAEYSRAILNPGEKGVAVTPKRPFWCRQGQAPAAGFRPGGLPGLRQILPNCS